MSFGRIASPMGVGYTTFVEQPIDHHDDEVRLAQRRQERVHDLGPTPLHQLEAGYPIIYRIAGQCIEEHPDGRRFVIEPIDGGRSKIRLREY